MKKKDIQSKSKKTKPKTKVSKKPETVSGKITAKSENDSEDIILEMLRKYLRVSSERLEIEIGMTQQQLKEATDKFDRERERSREQLRDSSERFVREMERSREHIRASSEKFVHDIEKSHELYKPSQEDSDQADTSGHRKSKIKKTKAGKSFEKLSDGFLDEAGFSFTEKSYNKEIRNPDNTITGIDIIMENDALVLAINVKSKPAQSDIDEHIESVELLQRIARRRNDFREYRGAVAGSMSRQIRGYVLEKGLYIAEKDGTSVKIVTKIDER